MQIDVDRQPKRRCVGTTGKTFPGHQNAECQAQILRDREREGEWVGKRKGQAGNGETSQTGRPRPSIVLVARPLGAFQTSENLTNWVSPKRGGLGAATAPPPFCLCMKINLNAGHKASPACFPINALRAHPNGKQMECIARLANILPNRCDFRMWLAVSFHLNQSTDIASFLMSTTTI